MIAMIAREHDDRILAQAEPVQRRQRLARLRVHETDTREVSLHRLPAQVVGKFVLLFFVTHQRRRRDALLLMDVALRERDFFFGITREVTLRRDIRRVRTEETDGEKKRAVLLLRAALENPLRVRRLEAVGMFLVGIFRSVPAQRAAELSRRETVDERLFVEP